MDFLQFKFCAAAVLLLNFQALLWWCVSFKLTDSIGLAAGNYRAYALLPSSSSSFSVSLLSLVFPSSSSSFSVCLSLVLPRSSENKYGINIFPIRRQKQVISIGAGALGAPLARKYFERFVLLCRRLKVWCCCDIVGGTGRTGH